MKTLKFYFSTAIICFVLLQGCDNLLDTNPRQSIDSDEVLTNADNVKSVLVGAYNTLGSSNLYGGYYLLLPDYLGVSNEFSFTGTFFDPREIFLKSQLYDNAQVYNTWRVSYETINITNTVMSGLDLLEDADRARVEGEARFIRGMVYFELVRLYAESYEAGQTNNQPGVPLILVPTSEIDDEANIPRSSVEAVYEQVLLDLTTARDMLPETNPERNYYANSYTASAVLSRVYLQTGDYTNARDEASRVISSGNYSLINTFSGVFNAGDNTPEDIFATQVTAQSGTNSMFTFYSASSRGDIDVHQAHIDEYEADDDRLSLFYNDPADGTLRSGKWNRPTDDNVNVIRLAEMYLTRAEANFRLGTDVGDTALNDINRIRARVNLDPINEADLDLDAILKERKLELMFEGHLLHDIKRSQGSVGSIPHDDPRLVLPIPRHDIDSNPNICQNPGYTGPAC